MLEREKMQRQPYGTTSKAMQKGPSLLGKLHSGAPAVHCTRLVARGLMCGQLGGHRSLALLQELFEVKEQLCKGSKFVEQCRKKQSGWVERVGRCVIRDATGRKAQLVPISGLTSGGHWRAQQASAPKYTAHT